MMNNQMMQALQALKANPAQYFQQMGINIPAGMNDPQVILQQLTASGRFSQEQINQAYQMAAQMRR